MSRLVAMQHAPACGPSWNARSVGLVALIAIVCIVALTDTGIAVNAIFEDIKQKVQDAL